MRVTEEQEKRVVVRKLPEAILKHRAEQRSLGILDSDDEKETFPATAPAKRRDVVPGVEDEQTPIELELQNWYRFRPPHEVKNPLKSWVDKSQDRANNPHPLLTKLAFDIYSIPAISSEGEQVFSQAKRVITDDRNRLSATTIEAIQCQKNWLSQKLVH